VSPSPGADVLSVLEALPRDAIPAAIARLAARLLTEAPTPPSPAAHATGPLLTPDEAAARLGVARRWVYRHAKALGAISLSRRQLRVPETGVARYLARQRLSGPP
jgi:excisionase family DNA binding protein